MCNRQRERKHIQINASVLWMPLFLGNLEPDSICKALFSSFNKSLDSDSGCATRGCVIQNGRGTKKWSSRAVCLLLNMKH